MGSQMTNQTPDEKYSVLLDRLRSFESIAVAFSGGVDSSLLLHAAHEALGERTIAITAQSRLFPQRELSEAAAFCRDRNIAQLVVNTSELEDDAFRQNPPNRCYLCKTGLLRVVVQAANAYGIETVIEGSNIDDEDDYRPGAQAIIEQGVMSPLKEAGLSKDEIRVLSCDKGLPTWNKQSFACLASRFAFGDFISDDRLAAVDEAEQYLLDRGFRQVRVRFHGTIARIEVLPSDLARLVEPGVRGDVNQKLKALGFKHVTLDLDGYRAGSMNVVNE